MCAYLPGEPQELGKLKSRLKELLNYYRMDSAQDPAILFEQFVFVFLGMWKCEKEEENEIIDFSLFTNDEVEAAYQQLLHAGAQSPLGRKLRGTAPEFAHKPELIRRLLNTAEYLFAFVQPTNQDLVGPVLMDFFEEILGDRRGGALFTPFQLAEELVQLIDAEDQISIMPHSVLDPASGSGAFLLAAGKRLKGRPQASENLQLTAIAQDEQAARCMQLLFTFFKLRVTIKSENWLLNNELPQYDIILANPPFHSAAWRSSPDVYFHNLPVPTRDTHRAFIQKTVLSLRNGGNCVVIVPDSFLFNTNSDAIAVRRWLLETCRCTGIVKLPEYTFYPQAQVKSTVLFLKKPERESDNENEENGIFFFSVEADGKSQDSKRQIISRNDFEELRQVWKERSKWAETWAEAARQSPEHKNMYGAHTPAVWRNRRFWFAAVKEIAQKDYILLPERYRPDGTMEGEEEEPAVILQELLKLQDEIKDLMGRLTDVVNDDE